MTAARQTGQDSCAAAHARHRMWPQGTSAVDRSGSKQIGHSLSGSLAARTGTDPALASSTCSQLLRASGRHYNDALKLDGNVAELQYAPTRTYYAGSASTGVEPAPPKHSPACCTFAHSRAHARVL